ncbi:helix-turn-helix domain-containing protein [Amycolatopsis nigrescens]|uniref:helix-turn-helix domain-containing protein n=1 Tax=Amycolatopsis nigrescens TaxID=381445 RepID=UPI00035E1652|nr:helix-turn-helix transcriptional regulator [Amycolatopsis nigrescens]
MRQLAHTLRRLREQVGLNQDEVADRLRFSKAKISRIEQGQLPQYLELLALLDLYGVLTTDYAEYVKLFDRASERGWWHAYGLDDRGFVSIEAEASVVRSYQLGHVPGLLQTEEYMREAFAGARAPLVGGRLESEVAVRLRRQNRLANEPPLRLHSIMDEAVLRRPMCTTGQLQHILSAVARPNVTVQVIPRDHGAHDGLDSSFIVVGFAGREEPDLAYLEYGFGSVQIEKDKEVRAANLLFDHLADLALDEQDSVALIERVIAEI